MRSLRLLLGSAWGLGFLPKAPGTWTSLAVCVAFALARGFEGDLFDWPVFHDDFRGSVAVLTGLLFIVGVLIGNRAVEDWGRKDPGPFVLDEVVGQLIPLIPLAQRPMDPAHLAVAFLAFRLLDILKPPPLRRLETLPGGVGIMADDVAAGLGAMAAVLLVAS